MGMGNFFNMFNIFYFCGVLYMKGPFNDNEKEVMRCE